MVDRRPVTRLFVHGGAVHAPLCTQVEPLTLDLLNVQGLADMYYDVAGVRLLPLGRKRRNHARMAERGFIDHLERICVFP